MKLLSLLLGSLALASTGANAQYFSDGWKPGQAASSAPAAAYTPGMQVPTTPREPPKSITEQLKALLDPKTLLTYEPVAKLFQSAGINITERLLAQEAEAAKLWDKRIPLINDDNYEELLFNEQLTEEEEADRIWFIVITVTAAKQEGLSKFLDNVFDSAFEIAEQQKDLPNVRWGRIDYLNTTMITTKWGVWSAPYLVVASNRAQTLRFYKPTQLRLSDTLMHQFLLERTYLHTPPWKSIYAPGGSREWVMHKIAIFLTKYYNTLLYLPKWAVYLLTGAIGSLAIGVMHRLGGTDKPQPRPVVVQPPKVVAPAPEEAKEEPKASGVKEKKGGSKRKGKK